MLPWRIGFAAALGFAADVVLLREGTGTQVTQRRQLLFKGFDSAFQGRRWSVHERKIPEGDSSAPAGFVLDGIILDLGEEKACLLIPIAL
jgi:hypothetical protein